MSSTFSHRHYELIAEWADEHAAERFCLGMLVKPEDYMSLTFEEQSELGQASYEVFRKAQMLVLTHQLREYGRNEYQGEEYLESWLEGTPALAESIWVEVEDSYWMSQDPDEIRQQHIYIYIYI